ncbi:unnamed protein product [Phytophthora lilii]|uniref:Unnamed protein product n=1 Tax=Phytophthora lilii TaxID=2077276 RepID=A0A9W6X549_9STRA|nr:unnamed protein product [Phytophthora lilii]
MLVVCSRLSLIRCARAQTSAGSSGGVQPARTSVPAARTAPSSSGSVDTSSSSAPAHVGSSSPDGSSKLPSATAAVETRAVQVCSGSHGASNLASAESSSPAPPTSVVTRESSSAVLPSGSKLLRQSVEIGVRSRVDAAKSLEEVVNAAVPCLDVGGDVTLDLATMRGQLYSAEAAHAAAEKSLHQEIYRRENAEVLAKTALGERDSLRVEFRRSKEAQAQLVKKVEQLNAIVATHNEVYAKLAKRVQAAKDHAQRVSKQLVREQEVFRATVPANPAQCSRLHRLLANSDVADESASARLRLRNEDLMERVQRLVKVNRILQARVQLEEMDPDVLVFVSEGSLILLVFLSFLVVNSQSIVMSSGLFTGEMDWEAVGVSDDTRAILRFRGEAADMETSVDLKFSSPAPSTSRFNVESRPSGFSKAKSKSRSPSSSESSAWSASTQDADDEDVLGGSSPPLTRPRSNSRPIVIDDDSDDDSESGVESERMTVSGNTVDSRVDNSRSAGSEASAVSRSNVAGHSPAREASASGALAPSTDQALFRLLARPRCFWRLIHLPLPRPESLSRRRALPWWFATRRFQPHPRRRLELYRSNPAQVYEFELWVMDHNAGVDVVLGMDFMVPAGIRLDLFHGTARMPDEVMVPLVKSQSGSNEASYGPHVVGGPTKVLFVPGREWNEFRLQRNQPLRDTHEVWLRRTESLVPTVTSIMDARTNDESVEVSNEPTPPGESLLSAAKASKSVSIATEDLQGPSGTNTEIHCDDTSTDVPMDDNTPQDVLSSSNGTPVATPTNRGEWDPGGRHLFTKTPLEVLERTFVSAISVALAGNSRDTSGEGTDRAELSAHEIELEDYARVGVSL